MKVMYVQKFVQSKKKLLLLKQIKKMQLLILCI